MAEVEKRAGLPDVELPAARAWITAMRTAGYFATSLRTDMMVQQTLTSPDRMRLPCADGSLCYCPIDTETAGAARTEPCHVTPRTSPVRHRHGSRISVSMMFALPNFSRGDYFDAHQAGGEPGSLILRPPATSGRLVSTQE